MQFYKSIILLVIPMGLIAFLSEKFSSSHVPVQTAESFYDFRIRTLEGNEVDFSKYRGMAVIVVNTASKCGYTPQYEELQKLHETYGDRVAVLGFPANNFLWQEPGSNEDIASFCQKNFGVTFQMFEKISVKGKDQHPLYRWLKNKSGKSPSWNFCKFVIDSKGEVKGFFPPTVKPLDPEILKLLQ